MRARVLMTLAALVLVVGSSYGQTKGKLQPISAGTVSTKSGLAVLGYGPSTRVSIVRPNGSTVWSGIIGNEGTSRIPLPAGEYKILADDSILVVSHELKTWDLAQHPPVPPNKLYAPLPGSPAYAAAIKSGIRPVKGPIGIQGLTPLLKFVPVPQVSDSHYADVNPPVADRHVIFQDIPTRLKAVVTGGVPPYTVTWDPGDGSGPLPSYSTSDGYNGITTPMSWTGHAGPYVTYNSAGPNAVVIGQLITATVTVTDSVSNAVTGSYYIQVGDPANRNARVSRSADEGMWYLHTQINRSSDTTGRYGYIYQDQTGGASVGPTGMGDIVFENARRSLPGGVGISHDPALDAYVDDVYLLTQYLTHPSVLLSWNASGVMKTYAAQGTFGGGTFAVDQNPPGAPDGIALAYNTTMYEMGMGTAAVAQSGFAAAPVPNRADVPSYYVLVGDMIDSLIESQATSGFYEGGAHYFDGLNVGGDNSADGSTNAWLGQGLIAASRTNLLTPGAPLPPLNIPSFVTDSAKIYLMNNVTPLPDPSNVISNATDYRLNNTRHGHWAGGFDYQGQYRLANFAKSGGDLAFMIFSGIPVTDPEIQKLESFMYRTLYTYDYTEYWGSSRDSYGMYNAFKGLTDAGFVTLTDPFASGGLDYDGEPLTPTPPNWYNTLVDFIAGTGAMITDGTSNFMDLGHQRWPDASGTSHISYYDGYGQPLDGHYESTGVRNYPVPPLVLGEWGRASSDANARINFITPWDIALLAGTVFATAPVDISVDKSANPGTVAPGANTTFTIHVKNNSTDTASGIVLTDNLPAGLTYVSASSDMGTVSHTGNSVEVDIASLAGGAQATITIVAQVGSTVPGGTVITNSATATARTADPNPDNNTGQARVTVQGSNAGPPKLVGGIL